MIWLLATAFLSLGLVNLDFSRGWWRGQLRRLAAGVPLTVQPVQYIYTQLPKLRPSLLADATRDAQQRARVLTAATGAHLGKLRGVDVGVFQVTSPNSTQVSDYGTYDTTTRDKDVTAVVNVTFALG